MSDAWCVTRGSIRMDDDRDRESSGRVPRSRVVKLLEQLIVRQLASPEGLADALSVPARQLEDFRSGRCRVPLQVQRRLADLIVDQAPELAREARRLQLQCKAEEAFQARETATHMIAPPSRFR